MATHSSMFSWRIPWTEEPGRLQSIGLQRVLAHGMHFFKLEFCLDMCPGVRLQHHPATLFFFFNFLRKLHTACHSYCCSVAQSCLTLCDPMDCSTPGIPVHHQLLEPTQSLVHHVGDAIQLSHPPLFPSPPAFNLSQHQDLSK